MSSSKTAIRLLAGACALGVALCGMLFAREQQTAPTPPVSNSAEEQNATVPSPPHGGLTVIAPKLSSAADAFLFLTEEGAVLMDTGEDPSAEVILNLLQRHGVTRLKALILTHFDRDHIGGAAAILNCIQVDSLYRNNFTSESPIYESFVAALSSSDSTRVVTVTDLTALTLGDVTFTLYPPLASAYDKNEDNNSSIITKVSGYSNDFQLLFTGDAEKARIKEFLNHQYDGTQYDLLKVPHHGRDQKPLEKLLKSFSPLQIIITSSEEEQEDRGVMDFLLHQNGQVWLTREGTVTVRCDSEGLSVTQQEE